MIKSRKHQQGISLYIIIILVMLSMLLVLWASRTSLFNEMIISNDADYQRAFEAAQAMQQDAENDIRQGIETGTNLRVTKSAPLFPSDQNELDTLVDTLETPPTKCSKGICQKRKSTVVQDFWNDKTLLTAMTAVDIGARYGQFTGATAGATSNPILAKTALGEGAWYWIEVMKYNPKSSSPGLITGVEIDPANAPFLYRITSIARGLKPSTQVVLQSVVAFPTIKGEAK